MPSLEALCDICSYFEITPTEFFDPDIDNPNLFHEIMDIIKKMPERDAKLLLFILNSNEERSNRNQKSFPSLNDAESFFMCYDFESR